MERTGHHPGLPHRLDDDPDAPRDILLTIGNEIIASANSFRCRYFEYLAYWPLMREYFENDPSSSGARRLGPG